MKKSIIILLFTLLGMTQAVSEDYEYVPFVREGVKWVYVCNNPFNYSMLEMPSGQNYYSFEMKGDVQIGDYHYKPVVLTRYLDKNGLEKEVMDFTPVYLREEDKVVYAIQPDGIQHPECPAGIAGFISDVEELPIMKTNKEYILYDFNNPDSMYQSRPLPGTLLEPAGVDTVALGRHHVKVHRYHSWWPDEDELVIEGVGYDGHEGMPLFYFKVALTGPSVGYGLSHVIEDGEIIYKGWWYDPDNRVGIDEVMTAMPPTRPLDPNYYNLTEQPVGTDVPTAPGIYIHQGRKICVR